MKNDEIIKIIESTAISIASSFPGLASIATGWNEYKNHIQTENIRNIIEVFYNKLNELEQNVNREYLDSDNLKALMIKTCFYGKEEVSKEKRKMLSYFLANSCTIEDYKDITKNSILETIIKLSEFDILIANMIADCSKNSQNSMLSGGKKYTPNVSYTVINELQIIENLKNHNEKDILMTLEYLHAVGMIENLSARGFNQNIDSYINKYLKTKEFDDLHIKREALSNPDDYIKNYSELKKLDEEEIKLNEKSEKEPHEHYDYQKTYLITALGLAVLSYLKE